MPRNNRSNDGPIAASRIAEGERLLVICNSCRYCEGYCAVFPAMEQRLSFTPEDVRYLANLCHNCAECYYACQFAPPHEFAVNVPRVFAEIRAESYRRYAWPAYVRIGGWLAVAAGLVVMFLLAGGNEASGANFYGIIPHESMVAVFSAISAFIAVVYVIGLRRFWKESGEKLPNLSAWVQAARDVLKLENLSSSGTGCTYPDEEHSQARRVFHHFTFYGFLLCLASTTVAAIYHFTGSLAPHPYFSAPVILGTLGGIGLLIGPVGLYTLKRRRDPAIVDAKQDGTDISFLVLLFLTSLTGLLLLVLRESPAMGTLLRVHLGIVFGLFLTLPYGKFVHGLYRSAALLRSAYEMARSKNESRGQSH